MIRAGIRNKKKAKDANLLNKLTIYGVNQYDVQYIVEASRPWDPRYLTSAMRPRALSNPRGGSRNLFLGGQTKVPNRKLRAKPESRARSAEYRERSPSRGREAPEN